MIKQKEQTAEEYLKDRTYPSKVLRLQINNKKVVYIEDVLKALKLKEQDILRQVEERIDRLILKKKQEREYTTYEDIHSDESCYNEQIKEFEDLKQSLKEINDKND